MDRIEIDLSEILSADALHDCLYGTVGFGPILEKDSRGAYRYANITQDSAVVTLQELLYLSPDDARPGVLGSLTIERVSRNQ